MYHTVALALSQSFGDLTSSCTCIIMYRLKSGIDIFRDHTAMGHSVLTADSEVALDLSWLTYVLLPSKMKNVLAMKILCPFATQVTSPSCMKSSMWGSPNTPVVLLSTDSSSWTTHNLKVQWLLQCKSVLYRLTSVFISLDVCSRTLWITYEFCKHHLNPVYRPTSDTGIRAY